MTQPLLHFHSATAGFAKTSTPSYSSPTPASPSMSSPYLLKPMLMLFSSYGYSTYVSECRTPSSFMYSSFPGIVGGVPASTIGIIEDVNRTSIASMVAIFFPLSSFDVVSIAFPKQYHFLTLINNNVSSTACLGDNYYNRESSSEAPFNICLIENPLRHPRVFPK